MTIRITEGEIKKLIAESVQRLLEFDGGFGGFGGGFDEETPDVRLSHCWWYKL